MKLIFTTIILLLLVFSISDNTECPQKGGSSNIEQQELDLLKNRTIKSKKINKTITLNKILEVGDDTERFKTTDYVEITGYVYDVKWGGPETCNCRSSDKSKTDIHIELVNDLKTASNKSAVVVEITRYSIGDYTYEKIKSMKGKKVKVRGWMFFDEHHTQNAVNTNPDGTFLWRATCWEVHPCQVIKEI